MYSGEGKMEKIQDLLAAHDESFPEIGDEWTCAVEAGVLREAVSKYGVLMERALAAELDSRIRLREVDRLQALSVEMMADLETRAVQEARDCATIAALEARLKNDLPYTDDQGWTAAMAHKDKRINALQAEVYAKDRKIMELKGAQ